MTLEPDSLSFSTMLLDLTCKERVVLYPSGARLASFSKRLTSLAQTNRHAFFALARAVFQVKDAANPDPHNFPAHPLCKL